MPIIVFVPVIIVENPFWPRVFQYQCVSQKLASHKLILKKQRVRPAIDPLMVSLRVSWKTMLNTFVYLHAEPVVVVTSAGACLIAGCNSTRSKGSGDMDVINLFWRMRKLQAQDHWHSSFLIFTFMKSFSVSVYCRNRQTSGCPWNCWVGQ